MKKFLMLISLLGVTAATGYSAPQQAPAPTPPAQQQGAKAEKHNFRDFIGEIKTLDVAGRSLTLKGKDGAIRTFISIPKVRVVTFDKNNGAKLEDLTVGDKVKVTYAMGDGKLSAYIIVPAEAKKKVAPATNPQPARAPVPAPPPIPAPAPIQAPPPIPVQGH